MGFSGRRVVLFLAALLPLVLASGCPGTDVLNTGNVVVPFTFEIVPASTRHEVAQFTLTQIRVRPFPLDSPAEKSLGDLDIGALPFGQDIFVDLLAGGTLNRELLLPSGEYFITAIELQSILLQDVDAACPPPACNAFGEYKTLEPFAFDPGVTFTISSDTTVTLRLDGQAFIDAFELLWPCAQLFPGSICIDPGDQFIVAAQCVGCPAPELCWFFHTLFESQVGPLFEFSAS